MSRNEHQALVPRLRFPEFRDAGPWETVPIGDSCESFSGGTPTTTQKDYYGGDIPFIRSAEIGAKSTELHLTKKGLFNSAAKMVRKGDVLIALYGANSGDVATAKTDGAINQAILCLRSSGSNRFLYQTLQSLKKWIVSTYLQGGQGNLSGEIVKSIRIRLPKLPEQRKIADCLSSLDELIAAQAQKIAALKAHKKGLLQQLFPRAGETVPRLRFPEFRNAGPWEMKRLGEFLTESKIRGNKGNVAKKLTVRLWGKGVFAKTTYIRGSENTQYYRRKAGQIIYSKLDFLNQAFGIIPLELDGYESTIDLPCFDVNDKADTFFILEYIKRGEFYKRVGDIADGSRKAKRIHQDTFLSSTVFFPSLPEQRKIADFLSSLDELIALEAQKLAALKAHKKGLLQQLFPQEVTK